jgi:hypothetical protein
MAATTHWAPNASAASLSTSGRWTAAVLSAHLVRARAQQLPDVGDGADPATDRQGMNTCSAVADTTS